MRLIDCFAEIMAFTRHFLKVAAIEKPAFEGIAERYDALIAHSKELCSQSHFSDDDWRESLFAVCCWVDESILCSDWPGNAKWPELQLQHRYLGTTNGGDEFFVHLAGLGPGARDVREVYACCLAMGFKGHYIDPDQQKELSGLIRTNFVAVQEKSEPSDQIFMFPSAYGEQKARRKTSFGIYVLMFLAAALPVVCFAVLYYFYGKILDGMVFQYFR